MPDNDNDPLGDAEKSLINFINSVRPESTILLRKIDAVTKWLRTGKISVLVCFLIVTVSAVFCNENNWNLLFIIITAVLPVYMIERLELLLCHRWKASLKLQRGKPFVVWHLHHIRPAS